MTICFGWITPTSAFLGADSAVTHTGSGLQPGDVAETSFGESTVSEPGRTVKEGALKIARLSESCAAAVAGSADQARAALRRLRYRLMFTGTTAEAVEDESKHVDDCELLVASHEAGAPRLWHVAPGRCREFRDPGGIVIGGATEDHKRSIQAAVHRAQHPNPRHMLAAALAAAQLRGRASDEMRRGVGGAFFGVHVTAGQVEFGPDILYAFVGTPLAHHWPPSRFAFAGWRSTLGVVRSSVVEPSGKYDTLNLVLLHDLVPLQPASRLSIGNSFENEIITPPYVALVDAPFGSYVFAIAEARPELVSARLEPDGTFISLSPHVPEIADELFIAARKRAQVGFCHIDASFPPRDLEPGGKWRLVEPK